MARTIATALGSALLFALLASGSALAAGEARVLDSAGRVLTVGNWETLRLDSGPLRVENELVLSFEYRDLDGTLLAEGFVPGTDDALVDGTPALSYDAANDGILAVWSRESAAGARELVALGFDAGGFDLEPRVLASGPTNQTDPDLIHDRDGNAYVAWRDMDWAQRVEILALDPEGNELFRRRVSTDETVQNGAPRLGVDATGALFVAYLGLDAGAGNEPRLMVHAANETGGGVVHVPSPIIELGRVSELDVTLAVPAPGPSGWDAPGLEITVLGGTPVLWWLTEDQFGRQQLNHAIRNVEGSWEEQPLGRIALSSFSEQGEAVREALAMIEARYRSVVSLVPRQPPVLDPRPRLGLTPELEVNRRR